jgi:hypothetical protein
MDIMANRETTLTKLRGFYKVTVEFLKAWILEETERADPIFTICYVKDRGPPIL